MTAAAQYADYGSCIFAEVAECHIRVSTLEGSVRKGETTFFLIGRPALLCAAPADLQYYL